MLGHLVDEFAYTIQLFQFARQSQLEETTSMGSRSCFASWRCKARRNGVLEVYDFGRVANSSGSKGYLGQCPSVRPNVDVHVLGDALSIFSSAFPKFVYARHGAAHVGDNLATRNEFQKHSNSKAGDMGMVIENSTIMLIGHVSDDTFSSSWGGDTVSCDISQILMNTKAICEILNSTEITGECGFNPRRLVELSRPEKRGESNPTPGVFARKPRAQV